MLALVSSWSYISCLLKLLRVNASLYVGAAASKVSLSLDRVFIRRLIERGNSRRTGGGWLDDRLMYSGSSLGFL